MFTAVLASDSKLWASDHLLNASMWSLQPFGSSEHWLAASTGELFVFEMLGCILMVSGMFTAVPLSFPPLCTSICMLDLSAWFPKPSVASEHDVVLPAGESGSFTSIGCILMFPTSSAGVITCICMFSMPGWWLDLSVSFAWLLAPMVSGSGSFDSIWCVLMISIMFAGFNASVWMLWASLCPIAVSMWLPMPSVSLTAWFASPAGEFGLCKPFWGLLTISGTLAGVTSGNWGGAGMTRQIWQIEVSMI